MSNIFYIQGFDDYLKIYMKEQKPYLVRLTMKAILEKVPATFIRVHRSYIVSLNYVDGVRNKIISLANEQIPIGNIHEEAFMKSFSK